MIKKRIEEANKWFDSINSDARYSELWGILSVEGRLELYEEYKKLVKPEQKKR